MKSIRLFLLLMLGISIYAQETYNLNWKINDDEKVAYLTVMDPISSSEFELPSLFKDLADSLSKADSGANTDSTLAEMKNFYNKLVGLQKEFTNITILQRKNDWIDVAMVRANLNKDNINDTSHSSQFMQGIQLRGLITPEGDIASFYTARNQKNLLALFFQLPSHPVKIGDKWPLDVTFLTANQTVQCDSMSRINEVELLDVVINGSDTTAFLKYTIHEKVSGTVKAAFLPKTYPSKLDMSFSGVCEFSISEGRWKNYTGITSYKSTGFQAGEYQQKFMLIEEKEIPDAVSKYIE